MNDTPIGQDIGSDAVEEMRLASARFWAEWGSRYPAMSADRKTALQTQLALILEQARGVATANHTLAWENIDFDPSAVGLTRPVPSTAQQGNAALWLKIDDGDFDWVKVWPVATNGGGGGVFVKAWAVDYTIGGPLTTADLTGLGWSIFNSQPPAWPYLTYPSYPNVSGLNTSTTPPHPGNGLCWLDQTSNMPIMVFPLANLGLPKLSTLAEFWIFAEIAQTYGDFSSSEDYWLGVGDCFNTLGSPNVLESNFAYVVKKQSYASGPSTSKTAGGVGTYPPSGGSVLTIAASAANNDNLIALRVLPDKAEVYSGVATSTGVALDTFDNIRAALTLRGHLIPSHGMRSGSEAAAWAGSTVVNLILTSYANRNGFTDQSGPSWKRLRIDYALAGSNSNGGTGMDAGYTTVAVASGDITGFGAGRNLLVSNAGPLVGIDSTGLADGTRLDITATVDLPITSLGSTTHTQIKGPFDNGTYPSWTLPAGEEVSLKLHLTGSGAPFWKYIGGSAG